MRSRKFLPIFLLAFALTVIAALSPGAAAQGNRYTTKQSDAVSRSELLEERFREEDDNRDGRLSRREWWGEEEIFERLDRNGDRHLSRSELLDFDRGELLEERFREEDDNRDGRLSRREWWGEEEIFERLDRNDDRYLSRSELLDFDRDRGELLEERFRENDDNRDGRLSRSEWWGEKETFERLNRNGDRYLSRSELLDFDRGEFLEEQFREEDANRDGRLSRREWWGRKETFERLDRNDDRYLSRSELLDLDRGELLAASNAQGPIEIQVKDLDSDQVIGTIPPGGSFTLREGQRVRLIMTALATGRGRGPAYPETEFTESEPGRGWVRVTRTNVENANATLDIRRPSNTNRNRTETLHYRIVENIGIPDNLRQGTITIHAVPDVGAGTAPTAPVTSYSRAQQLTNTLYRAILLRDIDPAGKGYVDRIANGGYSELIRVAEEIASSEESRDDALNRAGGSLEQRLAAIYQNLLGLSMSQIENDQRFEDMRRMRAGQIDDVVTTIVQSTRFQEYQNLSDWMAVRH